MAVEDAGISLSSISQEIASVADTFGKLIEEMLFDIMVETNKMNDLPKECREIIISNLDWKTQCNFIITSQRQLEEFSLIRKEILITAKLVRYRLHGRLLEARAVIAVQTDLSNRGIRRHHRTFFLDLQTRTAIPLMTALSLRKQTSYKQRKAYDFTRIFAPECIAHIKRWSEQLVEHRYMYAMMMLIIKCCAALRGEVDLYGNISFPTELPKALIISAYCDPLVAIEAVPIQYGSLTTIVQQTAQSQIQAFDLEHVKTSFSQWLSLAAGNQPDYNEEKSIC